MNHKLFTFSIISLLFSLISSKEIFASKLPISEVEAKKEEDFTILFTFLIVYTKVDQDGFIAHNIKFKKSHELKKEDVQVYLFNRTDYFNENEDQKIDMAFSKVSDTSYLITFPIKKNFVAFTYFKGLDIGSEVTVKAYYVTKGMGIFLIMVIIVGCLLVLALIFWIVKKILC